MATLKEQEDLNKITSLLADLNAKLVAVNTSVCDIKTSINNKGVDCPDGTPLSDYDDKIKLIESETEVDLSGIINGLEELGSTLDTINGEVITASSEEPEPAPAA